MKLEIAGKELFAAGVAQVWLALNDPAFLTRCIPGCRSMQQTEPDRYAIRLELKVASVGGTFEGHIALSEKIAEEQCCLCVAGSGTLGHGRGEARFGLSPAEGGTTLIYEGAGEIGGLVAGVGQRVLRGVAKHLIGQFIKAMRRELDGTPAHG
jgi:carbon monoxide dehydrogenase subunit G